MQKLLILRSPGVGPVKYNKLLAEYGDVFAVVDSLHLSIDFIDSVRREIDMANDAGIVYISDEDSNYGFTFNIKFNKLDAKNIVSFKLIPATDYDFAKNLYGIDSEGKEILLHKMN